MDTQNYLTSVDKQFRYYKLLSESAFNQLTKEELFWQYNEVSNSIGTMVNHISGNMLSRWTEFLTSDGEKTWRQRDQEFICDFSTRAELLERWEKGWSTLFSALEGINNDNFSKTVYIRNQGHSIVEAINRQLCHYSYHIGQIVYVARMIKGEKWQSLSIPIGKSKDYNSVQFSKPKRKGHFTDEEFTRLKK